MSPRSASLRRWLVLVAAGWFVAGVAVGLAWPNARAKLFPPDAVADSEEDYVGQMVREYGLTHAQQKQLRAILAGQRRDRELVVDGLVRDNWEQLPKTTQAQIRDANQKAERRLEFILTDAQRDKFRAEKRTIDK